MDAKITLRFDQTVIIKAKKFAAINNISLSRLMELLLRKISSANYKSLEDLPVSEWVNIVSEGPVEYKTRARIRKEMKDEYYKLRK